MGNDESHTRASHSVKSLRPLSFAKVVIESSVPHLDREYDYAIPEELIDEIKVGSRVQVPFGRQKVNGWVVERFFQSSFEKRIAKINKTIGRFATLQPHVLQIARLTAQYYAGTLSDVLRFAIPPRSAQVEKNFLPRETNKSSLSVATNSSPTARFLRMKTTEQWAEVVWNEVKTFRSQNKKVLIVVPEQDFINQFVEFAEKQDPKDPFLILSADSAPARRYQNFLEISFGQVQLVIGTRNAIFSPVSGNFAVIILHEYSDIYQSPQAPYWQVPQVAKFRQMLEGCDVLYVGYGISVTRYKDLLDNDLTLAENKSAPRRVSEVLNDLDSRLSNSDDYSATLWQALSESKFGPVLVQVPRKGFANLLLCQNCFRVLSCSNCHGTLRLLDKSTIPQCLRCASLRSEARCRHCGSPGFKVLQSGQGGVLAQIGRRFPGIPVNSSTKEKRIFRIDDKPSITVCTPGAAPIAVAGYRSIVVLNASTQFSNPKLEVFQEVFNQWLGLISQLKNHPQAKFVIHGEVDESLFNFFKSENVFEFIKSQYDERQETKLPPITHSVTLQGASEQVLNVLEIAKDFSAIKILGPVADSTQEGMLQAALLANDVLPLVVFAKNAVAKASLRGKENLLIKVDSIEFI
ncbi:MAG: hypothetical protein ACO39E_05735 [Candidatus Nanopelagicales bacterium]